MVVFVSLVMQIEIVTVMMVFAMMVMLGDKWWWWELMMIVPMMAKKFPRYLGSQPGSLLTNLEFSLAATGFDTIFNLVLRFFWTVIFINQYELHRNSTQTYPQYSALEEGVNHQCGHTWEEAAVDQVNWTMFFSVATKWIKVKAKRTWQISFLKDYGNKETHFQLLRSTLLRLLPSPVYQVLYSTLIVAIWDIYMWKDYV